MEASVIAALIALVAALVVSLINTFFGEDYRRSRDAKSLAGALAGELGSYAEAFPMLRKGINLSIERGDKGESMPKTPKFDKPSDRVFEGCVADIGLLGAELAEEVAYVYNNLNAFRVAIMVANDPDTSDNLQLQLLKNALDALERTQKRGASLPQKLKDYSVKKYGSKWVYISLGIFVVIPLLFSAFSLGMVFEKNTNRKQINGTNYKEINGEFQFKIK